MRRDWGVTLVVAALVVLSGCGALGGGTATPAGGDAPTTGSTDAPTPGASADDGGSTDAETATGAGTETSFPTLTPVARATPGGGQSLPPGVNADGSVNETALVVAHFEAANATGWRLAHRNGNDTQVLYSAGAASYERDEQGVAWFRDGVLVSNRTLIGAPYEMDSTFNTSMGSTRPTDGIRLALGIRLGTSNYVWNGTTEHEGRTLHALRMTGPKGLGDSLDHYTGRLLVDDSGRIHRLTGEVGENESVAQAYNFDYEWGVDSVPRPPWFDRVPRGVVEKTPDGTALNVTLTGGPAVPADTELTFRHDGTRRTVTLAAPLEPGESLYVGLRTEDGERAVAASREPLDGAGLVDLSGSQTRLSGTATVEGSEVDLRFTAGRLDF
ncbi:hypothetical protein [Halosimplex pelagicum]|uniref:Uncharacterized protein n=1 Tax=Halosimplex pelagicum TaxID=869886 RepID=A0A7D5TFG4_9EURY|nr:hypothetical protein [Halosimplex pelagicum]QLH80356.1 hypothetical protein HZS54_01355 [Halosimplex pelagicum]